MYKPKMKIYLKNKEKKNKNRDAKRSISSVIPQECSIAKEIKQTECLTPTFKMNQRVLPTKINTNEIKTTECLSLSLRMNRNAHSIKARKMGRSPKLA